MGALSPIETQSSIPHPRETESIVNSQELFAIDATTIAWEERFNEKLGRALYRKNLVTDPVTV